MEDLPIILLVAACLPFGAGILLAFGALGVAAFKKAIQPEAYGLERLIFFIHAALFLLSAPVFLILPITEHGTPALIGTLVGLVVWGIFFKAGSKMW
ncbi:hypothetical protein [Aeromonas media]|uniref:hypothetical protein n=1 Tax=Aeromonas media TaxID=651 RepID=UPI003D1D1376